MDFSLSWDEGWGPTKKGHTTSQSSSQSGLSTKSTSHVQQTDREPRPPIDLEWPPGRFSGVMGDGEQLVNAGTSTSSLDDIDPFADRLRRPTNTSSHSGTSNNDTLGPWTNNCGSNVIMRTTSINSQTNDGDSWASNNQDSFQGWKSITRDFDI